jgi:hypothetical protein
MSRNRCVRIALAALTVGGIVSMIGCLGKRSYLANRPVPPSRILQRVLVSIQNPSPITAGALQIVDARYDIRNSENGKIPSFFVGAYSGALPTTIINYPEQREGYVYNAGSGTVTPVNYSTEDASGTNPIGFANSFFVTSDGNYVFAANQSTQVVTVADHRLGVQVILNLPNVYKVSVNPSGTVALAFVQNSDYAYRIIRLQQPNGTVMAPPVFHPTVPWPSTVSPVNCQPVNLPIYCVVPVLDSNDNPIRFDRPYNTIFAPDGTTAWLLNCGPECGGDAPDPVTGKATASVSVLNLGPLNVYNFPGSTYPSPPPANPPPTEQQRISIPGGATMAVYGNGSLYISGQQRQSDGLFEGFLSVLDLGTSQVTATYPISDGTHTKMLFGDDNTLWIGSQLCQSGERTALNEVNGCLTMFNMNDNSVLVEPWYGDATGLCAIVQWHKVYTAQGGQIHIYATTDKGVTTNKGRMGTGYKAGSELDNSFVTVHGTAYDVAYMDAVNNAQD